MATAIYLEHYLDSIENLPCELQRNFTLMRELDNRAEGELTPGPRLHSQRAAHLGSVPLGVTCSHQTSALSFAEKKCEIDKLAEEYIKNVRNLGPDQRVEHLQKIQNGFSKCKEYSDDKVQLAMQTYEMVDKHIRRLDADLARFENELKEKLDVRGYESPDNRTAKKVGGRGSLKEKRRPKGRGRKSSDDDSPRKKKTKNSPEFSESVLPVHPSDVLDMPVDPNEPTYCLCHQVSYGEMIGCDNPDCPIEWFHFACVDLTTKPKGKWFCPRCTQDRKKK
ncbi:inhibitor of growth protein 5a isoform X1 [Puntigrus tetrazona]|uniref:inhibitor of growth protein 5a isoform X1 n=1 Tax=Puntigrus tetrazona TaxID=1606681 RepID=UPI001C89005D|nr:inhibitor of growth protein 5a isoform X1 [Puntigrus tetrazona]